MNRQDACEARKFIFCGTGILPVADNGATYQIDCQLTFYEQAGCLFHNKIDLLWNRHLACC
jgi:hypothetical protein